MLNNIEKNSPFRVPENYFQNFNEEIMNNLPEKKKQKKIVPLWRSVGKWVAAAAVVTGIAILGTNYMENHSPDISNFAKENYISGDDNLASFENDYYQFLEDDATQLVYKDAIYSVE
ncbi:MULTISPECIES: hypothetical protein [unclassified Dysgonomonas]|uniref:hypothetical protein n=1 Tax=unclassified Dysgonomonas TaxID=2630389 RepID=UPI000681D512|nr:MULTISPECIES: hypothetical protein [unclassified Dysgonomonas]MBD8347447.1 hypothetical protein [Dysgonomonas sp. HGC4]MBF0577094.1 hypothetical protein [Dysgonomonas sp. GY617]